MTLVNFEGELLIDMYVLPSHPILNYNTQYSGISAETLKDVKNILENAQDIFLQYVCSETILVGHSLENDLMALNIVHNKCIDTSVLFLTKNERKLKLKDLTQKFLHYKIQQGSHCSLEDARSCLSLAKLRIEIFDKFDSQKIITNDFSTNYNNGQLDLLDNIIKSGNTVLIVDESEKLKKILKYSVSFDEIKINTNDAKLDKIIKVVKKKTQDNNIIPRIILSKLDKSEIYYNIDQKIQEIFNVSKKNTVISLVFQMKVNPTFCIFIGK
ncbi:hypothetical protein IMG5_135590 [Ichthyophthirius multifiliis]|uniref:Exonuclease domain-containing protein n=1 Tax=Ichthyophthirius multifiliis TaxID=5932 RepID=G0QWV1_ICHMU|nr:hypothetical protein IMG5_135590 [Ichthyophthirius multifiliis]EGR30293.1 hypothetical protein IMG5_135590 [Ichthyophthirius multifiliis]|eukprot:XP_004031880.1 hypothetical protein IMG5_135590 [Ichthyophthirius multifiliis]